MENETVFWVAEVFNTSSGLVVIIDYPETLVPKIGMTLKDPAGRKWRIKGVGMPRPIEFTKFTFTPKFNDWIMDCLLEAIDHSGSLNGDQLLEVVQ